MVSEAPRRIASTHFGLQSRSSTSARIMRASIV
jgi:hypothetical protein